jgi:hypothetical protein
MENHISADQAATLLDEIMIPSSPLILEDRFNSNTASEAGCNAGCGGQCAGRCSGIT